ncbi:MAG: hypothetical protein ACR2GQ_09215 [Gemmatimonadota bacterium]|jgi:hypothetical protein
MKIEKIILRGLIAMSALFAAQVLVAISLQPSETLMVASWANSPESMEELLGLSEEVVHARVQRVQPGDDLVTDAAGEPEGHDRIPMEVVTLQVVDRVGGAGGGAGENTIQLFHTGLSKAQPPTETERRPPGRPPEGVKRPSSPPALGAADSRTIILADDPPYRQGEEYVLMLRRGPEVRVGGRNVRTQRVVSPEGRYGIRNGRVEPASERVEFARTQRGRSVDELKGAVQRAQPNARVPEHAWERRGR